VRLPWSWTARLRPQERHGFEYYRHGTLSLYAALDVKTGEVQGMTAARYTFQFHGSAMNMIVMFQDPATSTRTPSFASRPDGRLEVRVMRWPDKLLLRLRSLK